MTTATPARTVARKPAAPRAPRPRSAAKPAAPKPAMAELGKLLGSKIELTPAAKRTTRMADQRAVAEQLIKAAADLVSKWDKLPGKTRGDVSGEFAAECIGRWLSYLPSAAEWDARLGDRSDAGRRKS